MADIKEDCPCKMVNCPRHGNCKECTSFHVKNGKKPPACMRIQWTEYP